MRIVSIKHVTYQLNIPSVVSTSILLLELRESDVSPDEKKMCRHKKC